MASRWRYAVPNLFTAASIVFAVLAVEDAIGGRIVAAAWWGLYGTLTDRLDGAAAKLLDARSAFGVQFDSLADLAIFGIAPPAVFYAFYDAHPDLGWVSSWARAALVALCAAWTLATAVRLARFNVASAEGPVAHYTGTPSTMTAGIVGVAFLTALKYSSVALDEHDPWRLLDGARLDATLPFLPLLLLAGAIGMLSPLRVPKLGKTKHRALTVVLAVAVVIGYAAGLIHRLPEYMLAGGVVYLVVCVVFHLRTGQKRAT